MNKKKSIIFVFITLLIVIFAGISALFVLKPATFYHTLTKIKSVPNLGNSPTLTIVDENPAIFVAVASDEKLKEINKFFPKLYELSGFTQLELRLTTNPEQFMRSRWGTAGETLSGYTSTSQDKTITVEIFLNVALLKQTGFSEKKVANYVESLLIRALQNRQSVLYPSMQNETNTDISTIQSDQIAKNIEKELDTINENQLFLVSYE
ncbi:hypothetical protein KA078_02135 [Candidatus Woesebacteria bacterium]|nr:hypothetical protein [Candidatus Woesebacteria bacterium]